MIIHQGSDLLGAHTVSDNTDREYNGPCKVIDLSSAEHKLVGVFPTKEEATRIAIYSITPDGGYSSVEIQTSNDLELTHCSLEEWIMCIGEKPIVKQPWPEQPIKTYTSINSGAWGYLYQFGNNTFKFSNVCVPSHDEIVKEWGYRFTE